MGKDYLLPPTLIEPAAGHVITTTSTPAFCWSAADPAELVEQYRLTVDEDSKTIAPTEMTMEYTATLDTSLADGEHTWTVEAHSPRGQVAQAQSRMFTIDVTPPAAPVLNTPDDGAIITGTSVLLEWEQTADARQLRSRHRWYDGGSPRCEYVLVRVQRRRPAHLDRDRI